MIELIIKKSINNFLSLFGIGIFKTKIPKPENSKEDLKKVKWSDFEINSPIEHNTPKRMNEFFSDPGMLEQYLGDDRMKMYKEIVSIAQRHNINSNSKSVIDIGCGTGHLLYFFLKNYKPASVTGIDFSDSAIEVARKTIPEGNFFIHNLYEKLNKKFETILCTEVIEHLLDPDTALSNIMEMMSENSACLLTVPNGRLDQYEGHINFWSPESWEVFIKKNCNHKLIITGTIMDNKINYALIRNA
ncbi:MAG: class I SAM-dependent methyltransferase [Bacteroidota bacterium]|nr:class I SAM-dependent methyltransferase [Bacteroidota bacterium]